MASETSQFDVVVARYKAGESAPQIATSLEVSSTTIYDWLRIAKTPRRSHREAQLLRHPGRPDRYQHTRTRYTHRVVWEEANGPIPEDYHIHHKDGDRANNDLSNLELLSDTEHGHLHGKQGGRPSKGVIECVECGEFRQHYVRDRCKTCYLTWRSRERYQGRQGSQIVCIVCSQERIHCAKGKCYRCYKRENTRNRRHTGVIDSTTSRLK